jgi:hypothetical protein
LKIGGSRMFSSGCFALAVASMTACYSGNGQNFTLTCSDVQIQGLETCKDQMKRLGAAPMSTTSATIITTPGRP